jgi:hypothetical protein
VALADGRRVSGKRFLALALWQILTEGKVTLPAGQTWVIEPKDWLESAKWLYQYLDPPTQRTELTGDGGGPLYIIEQVIAPTDAPGDGDDQPNAPTGSVPQK